MNKKYEVAVNLQQDFTQEEQTQGRANIGAASASDVTALQSQVSSLSDVSAYSVKGEATVAQLNAGPSGIQAGWAYQLTDSGTLTNGSLAVVAGDTVAWDGTKWFPLVKGDYYATKTYAQNVAHSIAPEFDPTRDYVVGDNCTYEGTAYIFTSNHPAGAWNPAHATISGQNALLQLTSQNALAGNVAPEFVPNVTNAVAGMPYVYGGKLYVANEDYTGVWDSSKFEAMSSVDYYQKYLRSERTSHVDFVATTLWKEGAWYEGIFNTTDYPNSLCTRKIAADYLSVITIKRATGVSFTIQVDVWGLDGKYIGRYVSGSQKLVLADLFSIFPNAGYITVTLRSITGATATTDNLNNIVVIEDDDLREFNSAFRESLFSLDGNLDAYHKSNVNLNDKSLWHNGGLNPNTGDVAPDYYNRFHTDFMQLYVPTKLYGGYTLKSGVSAQVGIFLYDKDDNFLGWRSDSYARLDWLLAQTNYKTAVKFRFMLYNISGATESIENMDNILTFNPANFIGNRFEDTSSVDQHVTYSAVENSWKKKPVIYLPRKTKIPTVSFIFDDINENDALVANLFKQKGIVCGFAYVKNNAMLNMYGNRYLQWQNEGFEILNHSIDGAVYNNTNYATYQDAYNAMADAYNGLTKKGFIVNGFVAPSSSMIEDYKPIIGLLNAFGYVEIANSTTNRNTPSTPVTNLHRFSIQQSNTLQQIKDYLDGELADGNMVCFYGHAADLGTGDFTIEKISDVIDYVLAKQALGLCRVLSPTNAVREYYEL